MSILSNLLDNAKGFVATLEAEVAKETGVADPNVVVDEPVDATPVEPVQM